MKVLTLALLALGTVALSGCSSLPSFLGGPSKDIQAFLTAQAAGVYAVTITKDGKPLLAESWECTQANGQLTGCHKQVKP